MMKRWMKRVAMVLAFSLCIGAPAYALGVSPSEGNYADIPIAKYSLSDGSDFITTISYKRNDTSAYVYNGSPYTWQVVVRASSGTSYGPYTPGIASGTASYLTNYIYEAYYYRNGTSAQRYGYAPLYNTNCYLSIAPSIHSSAWQSGAWSPDSI